MFQYAHSTSADNIECEAWKATTTACESRAGKVQKLKNVCGMLFGEMVKVFMLSQNGRSFFPVFWQ